MTAALTVLDTEGLDALTMRRVAEVLGTGPASLYAHVTDKDEMVGLVVDRVFNEIELPEQIDPARWQEQLKAMSRSVRATYSRHRDVARASLGTIPTGEGALLAMNALVGVMLAGGVPPMVASLSGDILALYVNATAYEESLDGAVGGSVDEIAELNRQLRAFFSALPAERFPHLVAMAEPLTTGDRDDRFEFGLDLLVRGIASTVPKGAARRRSSRRPG